MLKASQLYAQAHKIDECLPYSLMLSSCSPARSLPSSSASDICSDSAPPPESSRSKNCTRWSPAETMLAKPLCTPLSSAAYACVMSLALQRRAGWASPQSCLYKAASTAGQGPVWLRHIMFA